MAKKKKKVKKEAEEKVSKKVKTYVEPSYVLGLASGLIILIAGILSILAVKIFPRYGMTLAIVGLTTDVIAGLVILIATASISLHPRTAAILILIFSLIAIAVPPLYGLIFGPLLGLIAAILLLIKKR
ncbi:MAG TPA: hypothetical protein ENF67_01895 [Candidatus Pacearchaeota archaeon]|nr:hypothetical protein [Candidatus Pacearchaeota archaeon]